MLAPRAPTRRLFLVHSDQATRAAIAHQAASLGYVVRELCSLAEAGAVLQAEPRFTTALLGRNSAADFCRMLVFHFYKLASLAPHPTSWLRIPPTLAGVAHAAWTIVRQPRAAAPSSQTS